MKNYDNIGDDEIRLIVPKGGSKLDVFRKWWFWLTVAVCVSGIVWLIVWLRPNDAGQPEPDQSLPQSNVVTTVDNTSDFQCESTAVLPNIVENKSASVIIVDTTVNDVALRLYTPQNAIPELCVGDVDTDDNSIIMAFQAADIRADNHQVAGDFVVNGKVLSNGKAKRAFCAIIDGKTYIGCKEETPLLDEAIKREGNFFRQYPLVVNGNMCENNPKGKAIRYALCEKDGVNMVVSSSARESFYDFAQALADFGMQQAIYLTGGNSYGFCRTESNPYISWGDASEWTKYADGLNFIVWKSVKSNSQK